MASQSILYACHSSCNSHLSRRATMPCKELHLPPCSNLDSLQFGLESCSSFVMLEVVNHYWKIDEEGFEMIQKETGGMEQS
ncbi:hypothetical protein RHGRI_011553 [Rhododendron griersonianum]|uniref:Uncharacterized protein n=1 Tax=Rhododendron griersonianum TaxID=479676 RepID=A0AAV6KMK7_9ERIC|nr:hypothetical protein RHGRI_011553 [Rhododendron griersonianum]